MNEGLPCAAHEDGVWSVAWTRQQKTEDEMILTASVDNTIKAWMW